jgi:hypothetical protein
MCLRLAWIKFKFDEKEKFGQFFSSVFKKFGFNKKLRLNQVSKTKTLFFSFVNDIQAE